MSASKRVSETEFMAFGKHELRFKATDRTYVILASDTDQQKINVICNDRLMYWPVEIKERTAVGFRLSGLTMRARGLLNDVYWFELQLCETPKITYWADQVVYREDMSIPN